MTIKFYKYLGAKNVMNKRAALALLAPLVISSDEIAGAQEISNPTLFVNASDGVLSGYNYVYITEWDRYYYVINTQWMSDGVYQIWLEEDYLNTWAVAAVAAGYEGVAKYSGLGDTNLVDSRCVFNPETTIAEYDIFFANTNAVPLDDWYCVKFMSTEPFYVIPALQSPYHFGLNVAIMNTASYNKFIDSYAGLTEPERTAVARMILSVNRVKYIAPDPTALADYLATSVFFYTPFDSQNSAINVDTGATSEYQTYIIPDPDAVSKIFTRRCTVVNPNTTTAHVFNTNNRFWELHAEYILKLPELQPIKFDPVVFGKKSSFTITFDIGYEPFSENYVIKFYPETGTLGNQSPVVQKCQVTIPFMADTSLDFYEMRSMTNALNMASGIFSGLSTIAGGVISESAGSVMNGLIGIIGAPINRSMNQQRMAVQEFSGVGLTGSLGGSIDWIWHGLNNASDAKFYTFTQTPVATFWSYAGKPDNRARSLLGLVGSGYAEIKIMNPPALSGATYNELSRFIELCEQGVIM